MDLFISWGITSIVFIIVILLIDKYYKLLLGKLKLKKEGIETNKDISRIIEKYIKESDKPKIEQKYKEIAKIVEETEKEIQKSIDNTMKYASAKYKMGEKEIITKGSVDYTYFTSDLQSAMPRTEEELKLDMEDLEEAMQILDSMDRASEKAKERKVDIGLGMFYERMSRQFKRIIKEKSLDKFSFIPIQRLKYLAFDEIKNLRNQDFLPILEAMYETKLLKGIIEINPALQIILFEEKNIEISEPEKVLISFVYEEKKLTKDKLMELTEWEREYANKILNQLIEKNIISTEKEVISIPSFNPYESRTKWNQVINENVDNTKKKEENKFERAIKRREELKQKLAYSKAQMRTLSEQEIQEESVIEEEDVISFEKIPIPKELPKIDELKQEKSKSNEIQEIKDKDSLIGAMEALDQEYDRSELEKIQLKPQQEVDTSIDFKEISEIMESPEDLISETILSFDEKYSMINGGFVKYSVLKDYILKKDENFTEELILKVIRQLLELKMINCVINIGDTTFYSFKDISLTEGEKELINSLMNNLPISKDQLLERLDWEEEKILNTIRSLQEKRILRFENNQISIPGLKRIA